MGSQKKWLKGYWAGPWPKQGPHHIHRSDTGGQPAGLWWKRACLFVCLIEEHKERRCTDKYIVLLFPKQQKVKSIPTEYQKGPISCQGWNPFQVGSCSPHRGKAGMFRRPSQWGAHSRGHACVPRGGQRGLVTPQLLSLLLHWFMAKTEEPLLPKKVRAGKDLTQSPTPSLSRWGMPETEV